MRCHLTVVSVAIPEEAEGKSVETFAMGESSKALFWPCHICPLLCCWKGCEGDSLVVRKQDTQISVWRQIHASLVGSVLHKTPGKGFGAQRRHKCSWNSWCTGVQHSLLAACHPFKRMLKTGRAWEPVSRLVLHGEKDQEFHLFSLSQVKAEEWLDYSTLNTSVERKCVLKGSVI